MIGNNEQRWQYKVVNVNSYRATDAYDMEEILNEFSSKGWELHSIVPYMFSEYQHNNSVQVIFKRPYISNNTVDTEKDNVTEF